MDIPELIKKEGLRRGLSPKTIKTYNHCVKRFLKHCNKDIKKINKKDVKEYVDKLIKKKRANNTINVHLNSVKFLIEKILGKRLMYNIGFSKTPKRLPTVLTKEEIKSLIDNIKNKKHRLIIEFMYSAGLRVGELCNLKVKDFEFSKNYGWVRHGKGKKDRLFIIANRLNKRLQDFIRENNLDYDSYLFIGNKRGSIKSETVNVIIKDNAKKAGIRKNVHCHTLRHSFATHLIENGYDVRDVQFLLGHNKAETTMVYLHTANSRLLNVKSPLDSL